MSEHTPEEAPPQETLEALRRQTDVLQQEVETLRGKARHTNMMADLRVAAVKAGMVDLDGIKLLDLATVRTTDAGEIPDASQVMASLKQSKPWLFGAWSTSAATEAPPSQPPQQKQAMEMSDDEYQAARALILKRRP